MDDYFLMAFCISVVSLSVSVVGFFILLIERGRITTLAQGFKALTDHTAKSFSEVYKMIEGLANAGKHTITETKDQSFGLQKVAECFTDLTIRIANIEARLDAVCSEEQVKELIERKLQ